MRWVQAGADGGGGGLESVVLPFAGRDVAYIRNSISGVRLRAGGGDVWMVMMSPLPSG